jgi:hypothetical protein
VLLSDQGYDTTYIDSGQLDWRADDRHSRIFKSTGLDHQIDANRVPKLLEGKREFEGKLALEKWAFKLAEESIFAAERRGRKAMIFLQTTLGHFPWPASRANEHLNAVEKLIGIASELDRLFDGLLSALQDSGLGENVIVVVTGDHGLRYRGEFESLGLRLSLRDVAFNVPLMIYAPGLIKEQVVIPYLTSHIDLAPTILELVGVPTDGLSHHGMNILDPRLASRITFFMNGKITPVNGYHWGGLYFTVNELTSTSLVSEDFSSPANAAPPLEREKDLQIPPGLTRSSEVIADARRMIGLTYAYLGDRRFGAINRE